MKYILISLSSNQKEEIKKQLKWRFNSNENEIEIIINEVVNFINSVETMIKPDNLEATVQNILKLVFDNPSPA